MVFNRKAVTKFEDLSVHYRDSSKVLLTGLFFVPRTPAPRPHVAFQIRKSRKKLFEIFWDLFCNMGPGGGGHFLEHKATEWEILLTNPETIFPPNRGPGSRRNFAKKPRPQAAKCAAREFNAVFSTFFWRKNNKLLLFRCEATAKQQPSNSKATQSRLQSKFRTWSTYETYVCVGVDWFRTWSTGPCRSTTRGPSFVRGPRVHKK